MPIVLFDTKNAPRLYPLALLHAVADTRMGIFTFRERWENYSGKKVFIQPRNYLSSLYETIPIDDYIWIDASLLPEKKVYDKILNLEKGHALADEKGLVAGRPFERINELDIDAFHSCFKEIKNCTDVQKLNFPWEMTRENEAITRFDVDFFTKNKKSAAPGNFPGSQFISPENIFIYEDAKIDYSIIDASEGPVFIGKNSTIMAGSLIRGPFVLGENSVLKMGTKIYGATTFGPSCTGGGEIKNTIFQGHSNKAHDGYLGDSVIGNWCNLGAGTSASNVKNTGGSIFVQEQNAGQKLGVIMGDYCRTAINTSLNTGTIAGICSNIFGAGLSPNVIPGFSWGFDPVKKYDIEKALDHIANWKIFKHEIFTDAEKNILKYIFAQTK